MTNCPNCGAPIAGSRCEYCGTIFRVPSESYLLENALCEGIITMNEAMFDSYSAYKLAGGNGMFDRIIMNGLENDTLTPNEARVLLGYPRI